MNRNAWLGSAAVVLIGLGIAALADSGNRVVLGMPLLPALAVLAFAIQWLAFIPSYLLQTEHYYDLTGSVTYLLVVGIGLAIGLQDGSHARAILLAVLVACWALRLGSFLFRRVRRQGKDGRFDTIKTSIPRFLLAWTLQGLWVFLTLIAVLIVMGQSDAQPLGAMALFGVVVWLCGFGMEVLADSQKAAFSAHPENRGQFIRSGLWAWSRHPNYFGEILLWLGVAIVAMPVFQGGEWLGLLSPLFVYVLLTKVSGVPLLEQRADEKWGDDPAYLAYRDNTPVLFPRPPRM